MSEKRQRTSMSDGIESRHAARLADVSLPAPEADEMYGGWEEDEDATMQPQAAAAVIIPKPMDDDSAWKTEVKGPREGLFERHEKVWKGRSGFHLSTIACFYRRPEQVSGAGTEGAKVAGGMAATRGGHRKTRPPA